MNIVYYDSDDLDETQGYFNPGNGPCQKTLSVVLKVECGCKLPKDFKLKLVLKSIKDREYNNIELKKIYSTVQLHDDTDTVRFTFINDCIPIPTSIKYIKAVDDDSNNAKCPIKPEITTGQAVEALEYNLLNLTSHIIKSFTISFNWNCVRICNSIFDDFYLL